MKLKGRLYSFYRYATGNTPWDSDEPKPVVLRFLAETMMEPGKVIDMGCGTGSNLIALAGRGWRGVGVDHVRQPLIKARQKARAVGVAEKLAFIRGDVRKLATLNLDPPYDLAMDLGCGHSLGEEAFAAYVGELSTLIKPGGHFLLFTYLPSELRKSASLDRDFALAAAQPYFDLVRWQEGENGGKPTCWYHWVKRA